jgi:predicted ATPase
MLSKIKIKGFKSIRELDLELRPINILIGANGVGKSNFISFFKLINNIYEQRLQQYSLKSGINNLLYFGRKNTSLIAVSYTHLRAHETG